MSVLLQQSMVNARRRIRILKPQDVFAASLYTGNGGTQTVTTGIDLATFGGLAWAKGRAAALNNMLVDTVRGAPKQLVSDTTAAQSATADISSFTSTGIGYTNSGGLGNNNGQTYVVWSFRRAPKFFDVVAGTSDGAGNVTFNHALGAVPGMVIVKCLNAVEDWAVWHRTFSSPDYIMLNRTDAKFTNGPVFSNTNSSTQFTYAGQASKNYVAYLFANDPSPSGVIQCGSVLGSYNDPGVQLYVDSLPWKPQFLLFKCAASTGDWFIIDASRNWTGSTPYALQPNSSGAEITSGTWTGPATVNGFNLQSSSGNTGSYLYMAIREPI